MTISDIKKLLATPLKIVITSHRNPDGDAIGSSLGMLHYLRELNHDVSVVFPSAFPDFVKWMPASDEIVIYDDDSEKVAELVNAGELIICLDFNVLDRIDGIGELIKASDAPKILIDHHINPDDFADYTLSDTTASSTCELVVDFIESLDDLERLNTKIGTCLFTGILTDTGSFKYSTSAKLYRIVAKLCDSGVNDTMVQDLLFNQQPEKRLRILSFCLDRMEIYPEYRTGLIVLTQRDYKRFDIQRGDTEGIVNYILQIQNICFAAFITQQKNGIKLSLRSRGSFSVQEIAQKHFRGGGHFNASGGMSHKNLRKTVENFKNLLPQYKDKLLAAK